MHPDQQPSLCPRCAAPVTDVRAFGGFCSKAHRLETSRQRRALIDAGPGCPRCYRGVVFFDWRPDGGRQRSPITRLESARAAPCWCPAGQRIRLETGQKAWGYLRDFNLAGEREIAPRSPPLARCRVGGGTGEDEDEGWA